MGILRLTDADEPKQSRLFSVVKSCILSPRRTRCLGANVYASLFVTTYSLPRSGISIE
jgi:hypothetical protein